MLPNRAYRDCILLLETSEEQPSADEVFRMRRNTGERGLLQQFPALVVGLAKASSFGRRSASERTIYRERQRAAIRRALAIYHPEAMAVFDVDLGHTDPQWVLPYGWADDGGQAGRVVTADDGSRNGDTSDGRL